MDAPSAAETSTRKRRNMLKTSCFCKAKKSVANFKVREGMETGLKVTLRGARMWEFLDRLITLAAEAPMPQVRAIATSRLRRIAARLKAAVAPGDAQAAHGALIQADIARFLARPYPEIKPDTPPTAPPTT